MNTKTTNTPTTEAQDTAEAAPVPELTALEWLLAQPISGTRDQADIDAALSAERDW